MVVYGQGIVDDMNRVQNICSLIHFARKLHAIPTVQPLMSATLYLTEELDFFLLSPYKSIIADECNLEIVEREFILPEDYDRFHIGTESKLNFREAGKILGKDTQRIGKLIATGSFSIDGNLILVEGRSIPQSLVETKTSVDNETNNAHDYHVLLLGDSNFLVLDIMIYSGLYMKRLAQEIVKLINSERRSRNYSVSDVVAVGVEMPEKYLYLSKDLVAQIQRDAKCILTMHPVTNNNLPPNVVSMFLHIPEQNEAYI